MFEKNFNRRAALAFLGGSAAGATIDNGLRLLGNPDIPLRAGKKQAEVCHLDDVAGRFEAGIDHYCKLTRRINDYTITKKRAQKESSLGSDLSREAFIKKTVDASTILPDYLKSLICYIPYEESKFNTAAKSRSNPPAVGTWQFMPGTAGNPAMVGPHIMVREDIDRRTDFELSTKAAVKYFEYIYLLLSADRNYQTLKNRYQLDDNGFLSLTVLHAYNAGEGHMQRAFEVLAKEPSIRAEIDSCGAKGSLGLYLYLTEEYIKHFKKWQKHRPYFHKESAAYAYKVLAFRKLDNPTAHIAFQETINQPSKPSAPADTETPSRRQIHSGVRAAIGGVGTLVGWGSGQLALEKIGLRKSNAFNRREFVMGASITAGGAIGALISDCGHRLHAAIQTGRDDQTEDTGEESAQDTKATVDNSPLSPLTGEQMSAHKRKIEQVLAHCQSKGFLAQNQEQRLVSKDTAALLKSSRFLDNRLAADTAYEIYLTHSDSSYLQIAQYFYSRALQLTEEQLAGKIAPPPAQNKAAALQILQDRKNYLQQALRVINADFKNGN